MGLFSLFKKSKAEEFVAEDDEEQARLAANSELQRQRVQSELQREIARATAMKIDAIEAAMAADIFNEPEPAWRKPRPPRPAAAPVAEAADEQGHTLPLLEQYTTELLGDEETPAEAAAAESAPIVEEIAILYANGQTDAARQILAASVREAGAQDRTIWWMLFDLYQALGDQDAFDDLSIDYASQYETSPPAWNPAPAEAPQASPGYAGLTPTVALAGVLDGAIAPQLAKVDSAPGKLPLRFDFSRVTAVEADGCALLLEALDKAQQGRRELILAAAPELTLLVRAMLEVGRRDEGEAPWLLQLELLRLQNREKDFEEASMDYCVTFEVSPPPFVPPSNVANAPRQAAAAAADRFMLPPQIDGDPAPLLAAISGYADQYPALVFDCSRLARIEFGAAGQLLARLNELAADGRRIEFRDVNHLVAALLRLLGFADIARLFPHRY